MDNPDVCVGELVLGRCDPTCGAGVFFPKRVALSVAFAFNAKWTYCEFHPPVSRGGKVAGGEKRPHLDELQMLGCRVPRSDHLSSEFLAHLWEERLDCCLNVVVSELADRYPSDIEQSLIKVF